MPVIGSVATSTPDVPVTSSDGKIRATPRTSLGSVSLRVVLASNTTRATIWRDDATSGRRVVVRTGDSMRTPGGSGIAFDHEAPPGSVLTYTVIPADGTGAGVVSTGATVRTAAIPTIAAWVKDPHYPANSLLVTAQTVFRPSSRQRRQGVFDIIGRTNPVVVTDSLGARTGDVVLLSLSRADRVKVRRLLDTSLLLIQLNPTLDEPDRFVSVATDSEDYIGPRLGGVTNWTLGTVEVDRPSTVGAPLMIPGQSYADFANTYATYQIASAAFAGRTYLDVIEGI